jgi:FkbM family methyltransferase
MPTSCFAPMSAASASCCRWSSSSTPFACCHRPHGCSSILERTTASRRGRSGCSTRPHRFCRSIANPSHEGALKRTKAALELFDYKLMAAGERRGELVFHTPVFRGIALTAYAAVDRSEAEQRLHQDMPSSRGRLSFIETVVPVLPIDDLTLTPDFVKIDVEGFEIEVLRGMMATIERCKPVFMIEFDPGRAAAIADILSPCGYRPYVFDRRAGTFRPYDGGEADNLFHLPPRQQSSLPIIGPRA